MLYMAFDTPNRMPGFWFDFQKAQNGKQIAGTHDLGTQAHAQHQCRWSSHALRSSPERTNTKMPSIASVPSSSPSKTAPSSQGYGQGNSASAQAMLVGGRCLASVRWPTRCTNTSPRTSSSPGDWRHPTRPCTVKLWTPSRSTCSSDRCFPTTRMFYLRVIRTFAAAAPI